MSWMAFGAKKKGDSGGHMPLGGEAGRGQVRGQWKQHSDLAKHVSKQKTKCLAM